MAAAVEDHGARVGDDAHQLERVLEPDDAVVPPWMSSVGAAIEASSSSLVKMSPGPRGAPA